MTIKKMYGLICNKCGEAIDYAFTLDMLLRLNKVKKNNRHYCDSCIGLRSGGK